MHVTIVGAGVLGRIYGVRLAAVGAKVSFVVRPARLEERSPFVIEQVNGARRRDEVDHPERVAAIPDDATAVIHAVRFDQMACHDGAASGPKPHAGEAGSATSSLSDVLRGGPKAPIVVL